MHAACISVSRLLQNVEPLEKEEAVVMELTVFANGTLVLDLGKNGAFADGRWGEE